MNPLSIATSVTAMTQAQVRTAIASAMTEVARSTGQQIAQLVGETAETVRQAIQATVPAEPGGLDLYV